ncbi:hypothetical protein HW450_03650 [Corynebacterium hindlerae]|uniref:Uncharacterized protein n=1 Tax=Corynebacterium hindlerae TaxID=699041 RepID=A0A7G5FGU8_9CORY|nr:hypothetical protein [Corynebacterium hindlerae]QMV85839.1 hypothetical protein HW450_03650 [Corynebacterium hindlerae]
MADEGAEFGDGRWNHMLIQAAGLTSAEAVYVRRSDFHFTRDGILVTTPTRIAVLDPSAAPLAFEAIDDISLDYLMWPGYPRAPENLETLTLLAGNDETR